MVRSEGNMSLKNPVTPTGIDPGTVGLVAQRLNPYRNPGLHWSAVSFNNNNKKKEKDNKAEPLPIEGTPVVIILFILAS